VKSVDGGSGGGEVTAARVGSRRNRVTKILVVWHWEEKKKKRGKYIGRGGERTYIRRGGPKGASDFPRCIGDVGRFWQKRGGGGGVAVLHCTLGEVI